jgi:hypothetical protein
MRRIGRITIALIASLLLSHPSAAEPPPASSGPDLDVRWSVTLEGTFPFLDDQESDDNVTGFFDQYEFTPNKSDGVPFQLGIPDAFVDVFAEGDTPRLQFRLASPTSNLGVTGPDVDQPFLNQRADLFGRLPGLHLDVDYRRFRTDEMRWYSVTGTDLASKNDRYYTRRSGFDTTFRVRIQDLLDDPPKALNWLGTELTARGGYQSRSGNRQLGFMSNNFQQGALTQKLDQSLGEVGGGLLFAPGGLFTIVFDFDHEQFREDKKPIIESDLGPTFDGNSSSTIGFIPDTDRSTGSVRLHGRIGERATLHGGFQASRVKQVDTFTPWQRRDGLKHNELMYYSANFAADVQIVDGFSTNAFFKYDRRNNDIDRSALPFDVPNRATCGAGFPPANYCQVAEFVDHLERISAGLEFVYQPMSTYHFALGARGDWVDRDLDFVQTAPYRILEKNALIDNETSMWTVYGRARLRPANGLGIRGEVGYRGAPKTGYITELDDYVYGNARITYALPIDHPILLSAFGQGSSGKNRDFEMVDGQGPVPNGSDTSRDFDRYGWTFGFTASTSFKRDVSLFASFFHNRDDQEYNLIASERVPPNVNGQRYFQDAFILDFNKNDSVKYQANDMSVVVGTAWQATDKTDLGLSYAYTRAKTKYESRGSTTGVISDVARINSEIHRFYFDVGHWLMDGLRLSLGYRYDFLDDHAYDRNAVTTSNATPFDPSSDQHTLTFGATITHDLFAGGWGPGGSD